MAKPDIIRVWGSADSFDIEFTRTGGTSWKCEVPPDTSDGVYAVTLYAINSNRETACWVGELFMCNGICHLKLKPRRTLCFFAPSHLSFTVSSRKLIISKGCEHK